MIQGPEELGTRAAGALPAARLALRVSALLAGLAFAYTATRAALLSLTHDEALTYLLHVKAPLGQVLAHGGDVASNNHLLNTLLIRALVGPLGNSEFVLRMPALLGHALYLTALLRLLARWTSGARLVLATAALASNPMLLDFFSCARGYALGLGFELLALECLLSRWRGAASARGSGALAVAALAGAVLANLSFANLFVASVASALMVEVVQARRQARSWRELGRTTALELLLPAALAAAFLAAVYNPAALERIGRFVQDWGGTRGFVADTLGSVVEAVLHARPQTARLAPLFSWIGVGLVPLATALAARGRFALPVIFLSAMLAAIALSIVLQFHLAGRGFALERSAIYLVPPFLLLTVFAWQGLAERAASVAGRTAAGLLGLAVAALCVHGVSCLNLTHHHAWRYDAATKQAVLTLREHVGEVRLTRPYTLGVHWRFQPSVEYYLERYGLYWIRRPDRRGPDGRFDATYALEEERGVIERYGLEVLATYPLSGAWLAVRR
jgi:hypothetical protein